jgi:hypothetical protein
MALIEIDVPEAEGWRDDVAMRLLFIIFAAILMRLGLRLWAVVEPAGVVGAIPTLLCFAGGVQFLVFAVSDIDLAEHGRTIGYGSVLLFTVVVLAVTIQTGWPRQLATDAIAFTSYSVELVAQGQNPMAASMAPAAELPETPERWTYRVDGTRVESWSYPAGMFWTYLPQYLLIGRGPIGIRLTSILAMAALGLTLVKVAPAVYGPAAGLVMIIPRNQYLTAAGGLVDVWWLLPTVLAVLAWYTDRRLVAAGLLGVACAMKQQPWPIAGFLAIWLWKERESLREFAVTGGQCAAVGFGAFAVLNLPFFLASPPAWLESVLVPLGGGESPLRSVGVGLAALNHAGLNLPRSTFRIVTLTCILSLLGAYWYWFDRLKWIAWLAPPIILLWTPRSLPSYFNTAIPLAFVVLLASEQRLFDEPKPEVYRS